MSLESHQTLSKNGAHRMPLSTHLADPPPWKVLIVDDDPACHERLRAALSPMTYLGRPLEVLCAGGMADARTLLDHAHTDIAVAVITPVKQVPGAARALAEHVRYRLHNQGMRLLLHTHLGPAAPKLSALQACDFNGYLDRGARDAAPVWASVLVALRAHHEVTSLLRAIEELRHRSITDPLTGLNNPSTLRQTLTRALSGGQRRHEPLTVLFLDIDHFKLINDEQGHLRGDEILRAVGSVLRSNSRMEDTCYRYGGDEFLVILPNCTAAQVEANYLPRLLAAFQEVGISVSHGAADAGPHCYPSADELIRFADERMYQRKRAQRRAPEGILRPTAA